MSAPDVSVMAPVPDPMAVVVPVMVRLPAAFTLMVPEPLLILALTLMSPAGVVAIETLPAPSVETCEPMPRVVVLERETSLPTAVTPTIEFEVTVVPLTVLAPSVPIESALAAVGDEDAARRPAAAVCGDGERADVGLERRAGRPDAAHVTRTAVFENREVRAGESRDEGDGVDHILVRDERELRCAVAPVRLTAPANVIVPAPFVPPLPTTSWPVPLSDAEFRSAFESDSIPRSNRRA